ncbi:metal ABC transporter substrate-binding protein [Salinirubrum litoreum]|uniref:Metal ABC transporter substrate-binding protein n=1 Tax=Salinirubrum litoreum TaxID=1126234 RepID=A0ABD5R959_9EURY|nr:zinc ABC transporter substrate-binding protein [Salinirubrum litoreum]
MRSQTRRRFLLGTSGAALTGLAGCLGRGTTGGSGSTDGTATGETAESSFFVVSDFASAVAGDVLSVGNLVPFGQHGHGWEPGPTVQRRVLDADAFLYVGDGFQPWADRIRRNLRDDGSDVPTVEAWAGVDLLAADGDEHGDHDETHDDEHHDDEHHDDETETHDDEHHDDHETETETHDDEHHDDHESGSDDGHDDHDHGAVDPHFWLDPERAKQAVGNIEAGLTEVVPDQQETLASNADRLRDDLDSLDATYRERLSGRTRDTILVAGHNSFRYLARRYDFDVEALTGLAPDAAPTPQDVRRAQDAIAEHDVEYVLAPVFESDRAARQLVAETDATGVLPLTPVPSLTPEWNDRGWGYLDVMEQVNLPSLARALGAETE